jgi:hypothetical protein
MTRSLQQSTQQGKKDKNIDSSARVQNMQAVQGYKKKLA